MDKFDRLVIKLGFREEAVVPAGEVVVDGDGMQLLDVFEQVLDEAVADVAGTAGDENFHWDKGRNENIERNENNENNERNERNERNETDGIIETSLVSCV